MEGKEPYFGSVRFFRHLILTTVALMILIPVCLCIYLGIRNVRISKQYQFLRAENQDMKEELSVVQTILDKKLEAEAMAKAEAILAAEEAKASENKWKILLANDSHPLDQDFVVELTEVSGGQRVDQRIAEPLSRMLDAMKEEGLEPIVCSGYRNIERQTQLFQEYIEDRLRDGWSYEEAFYKAKTRIALQGTSEHQTGLAVDIVGRSHQRLDDGQAETDEAKWLAEHCSEYGFILRYPQGKLDVTGLDYESWHFRYVGEDVASYIMEHGITLEEYLNEIGELVMK